MKNETIRLITNDLYATNPCVMTEAAFYAACEANGWDDCHFEDAGPIVTGESDFDELSSTCRRECVSQYREITQRTNRRSTMSHYDGNPNNEPVDIVCPECKQANLPWIDRGDGKVECPHCEGRFQLYPITCTTALELAEQEAAIAKLEAENARLRQEIKESENRYRNAMKLKQDVFEEVARRLREALGERDEARAALLTEWGRTHA